MYVYEIVVHSQDVQSEGTSGENFIDEVWFGSKLCRSIKLV